MFVVVLLFLFLLGFYGLFSFLFHKFALYRTVYVYMHNCIKIHVIHDTHTHIHT